MMRNDFGTVFCDVMCWPSVANKLELQLKDNGASGDALAPMFVLTRLYGQHG